MLSMKDDESRVPMTNADVLIVGGGAAGLACGRRLAECGVSFVILEAADRVGGRLRTDTVDGFRLDRAFPFFLAAATESQRLIDRDALELKPFAQAVLVRFNGRFHRFAANSLWNPIGTVRDKLRLVRFLEHLECDPGETDERLALDLLRWNGRFTPAMIDRFFRPLAGWLFHDRSLAVSSRLFRFAFRPLLAGPVALPAYGMQAIADQLAERLPPGSVRVNATVERVGQREVMLAGDEVLRCRAVIDAARITESQVAVRAATTLFYSAERPPMDEPILLLDGEGRGPVNHLAVLSNMSAAYAPPGRALIAAGVLGEPDEELDRRVRVQLAEWFGAEVPNWKLLGVRRSELPDMTAGTLDPWQRPVRVHPGLYACGMHRDNATLDGALTSGFRAAQAAMEDIHAERT